MFARQSNNVDSFMKYALAPLVMIALMTGPGYAASPFKKLAGTWSGGGSVRLTDGKKERIKCRAYYTNKATNKLGLAIRCATPSGKIEMRAKLNYNGGSVSGTWEERTYNAEGALSGSASSSNLTMNISGALQGTITISISGSSQRISIATTGGGLANVNISLRRRSS